MFPDGDRQAAVTQRRWRPARLIVLGAALFAGPAVLDAFMSVTSNLAFLSGSLPPLPYWAVLLDAALVGLLVPVGFFLALCGVILAVRASRPPGHPLAFRAALSGAGLNLAAGLILGLINFSSYLVPFELETRDLVRSEVIVVFVAAVAVAVGALLAFLGLAALVGEAPSPRSRAHAARVRVPRGKSIYRGAPSAR